MTYIVMGVFFVAVHMRKRSGGSFSEERDKQSLEFGLKQEKDIP